MALESTIPRRRYSSKIGKNTFFGSFPSTTVLPGPQNQLNWPLRSPLQRSFHRPHPQFQPHPHPSASLELPRPPTRPPQPHPAIPSARQNIWHLAQIPTARALPSSFAWFSAQDHGTFKFTLSEDRGPYLAVRRSRREKSASRPKRNLVATPLARDDNKKLS